MKRIGYWIESLRDRDYFPPQEFVGDLPTELRLLVADYLDRGQEYGSYRGVSWCRFFCDHPMGHRELTDGSWVWPEGLSHYVRDHRVVLPDEFISQVQSGMPPQAREHWESSSLDDGYWKAWCRTRSSGRFRAQIDAALLEADRKAESIIADVVAQLEASHGQTNVKCQWADCSNRALCGRVFCGRCLIRGSEETYVSSLYFDLQPILGPATASEH
jgi:hypothetical protein